MRDDFRSNSAVPLRFVKQHTTPSSIVRGILKREWAGDIFVDEDNGWTIYTDDDEPSAQWEIMVLVTDTGYEVMSW